MKKPKIPSMAPTPQKQVSKEVLSVKLRFDKNDAIVLERDGADA